MDRILHLLLPAFSLLHLKECLPLLLQTSLATFPDGLVLDTAGFHLVGEDLCTRLFGFGLVDVLHEHTLVLENITLGLLVEGMV